MRHARGRASGTTFWVRTMAALAVLAIGLAATVFRISGKPGDARASVSELQSGEKAATIRVTEGSGWLSTGEELRIAEWYTGSERAEGEYFANFRGSDGGATVDLRVAGLTRTGTFACAEPEREGAEGSAASIELRVDVQKSWRSERTRDCSVTVTSLDGQLMEGHYTATLVNSGDAQDNVTISGRFRATRPQPERLTEAPTPRVAEF